MTDILQYPSCKLYENGSFRLPVKIRKELISKRFKRLVIAADTKGSCVMYPVSVWEKRKKYLDPEKVSDCPKYPQSLDKTFLHIHQRIIACLENPEKLYFEFNGETCRIYSESIYEEMNVLEKDKLNELYESL